MAISVSRGSCGGSSPASWLHISARRCDHRRSLDVWSILPVTYLSTELPSVPIVNLHRGSATWWQRSYPTKQLACQNAGRGSIDPGPIGASEGAQGTGKANLVTSGPPRRAQFRKRTAHILRSQPVPVAAVSTPPWISKRRTPMARTTVVGACPHDCPD